jgi:hypothetical protein
LIYFSKFHYTTPLPTALIFVGFVIAVDFLVVALLINKSLDMFASLLGTWIPFGLIFISTYVTGLVVQKNSRSTSTILKHSGAQLVRPTVCATFNDPIREGNQV